MVGARRHLAGRRRAVDAHLGARDPDAGGWWACIQLIDVGEDGIQPGSAAAMNIIALARMRRSRTSPRTLTNLFDAQAAHSVARAALIVGRDAAHPRTNTPAPRRIRRSNCTAAVAIMKRWNAAIDRKSHASRFVADTEAVAAAVSEKPNAMAPSQKTIMRLIYRLLSQNSRPSPKSTTGMMSVHINT